MPGIFSDLDDSQKVNPYAKVANCVNAFLPVMKEGIVITKQMMQGDSCQNQNPLGK
jgi:hypothetical protein